MKNGQKHSDFVDVTHDTLEEQRAKIWEACEGPKKQHEIDQIDRNQTDHWLEDAYKPSHLGNFERGTGMENLDTIKQIFVEMEHILENEYAPELRKSGYMDMYKGTLKSWQVLDDDGHLPEEIKKIQQKLGSQSFFQHGMIITHYILHF